MKKYIVDMRWADGTFLIQTYQAGNLVELSEKIFEHLCVDEQPEPVGITIYPV